MDLKEAVPVGLGAAVTAAVAGVLALFTKRTELSRSPPAAMASADAEVVASFGLFVEKLGESWSKHTDALRDDLREQAGQIVALKAAVEACEAHRAEDQERHAAVIAEVQDLREQLGLKKVAEQLPLIPGLVAGDLRPKR